MQHLKKFLWVLIIASSTGCSLHLLEPYDPEIEKGISDYHTVTIEYLNRIIQDQTSPENSYASPESQKYYADSGAKLSDLVVKADTNSGPKCSSDQLAQLNTFAQAPAKTVPASISNPLSADVSLSAGTCTAVALRIIQADHVRMQDMHQRRKELGKSNAQLWSDFVNDSTRMALTIAKSTKP